MNQKALMFRKSNDDVIRTLRFHFRFAYPSSESSVIDIPFNKVMMFAESNDRGFGKDIPEPKRWVGVFNERDSEQRYMYHPYLTLWSEDGMIVYSSGEGRSDPLAQIIQLTVTMDSLGTLSLRVVSKSPLNGGGIGMNRNGLSIALRNRIYDKVEYLPSDTIIIGVIDITTYFDPMTNIPYDILNSHANSFVEYYGYEPPV